MDMTGLCFIAEAWQGILSELKRVGWSQGAESYVLRGGHVMCV